MDTVIELKGPPPSTRRGWLALERKVQELHPLASILTRTRKRDVLEDAATRRAKVVKCQLTVEEERLYTLLVTGSRGLGWLDRPVDLGGIQRARQAASCLPATAEKRLHEWSVQEDELADIDASDVRAGEGLG